MKQKFILVTLLAIILLFLNGCSPSVTSLKNPLNIQFQEGIIRNTKVYYTANQDYISYMIKANEKINEIKIKQVKTDGSVTINDSNFTKANSGQYIYIVNILLTFANPVIYKNWDVTMVINNQEVNIKLNDITVDNLNPYDDTVGQFRIGQYIQLKNFAANGDSCLANNTFHFINSSFNNVTIKSISSSINNNIEEILINNTKYNGDYIVFPNENVIIDASFQIPANFTEAQFYSVDYMINNQEYTSYTPNFYSVCHIN